MHYFNMIFIFTLFFSHEFAYIDRSERKIVNVIATWRYERGKRETGRRVSRLSIGGILFYGTCTSDVTDRARKAQVAGVKRAREVH